MPNLIDRPIEDRALRHRFILFLYPFTIIGGMISVTCSLLARYYREATQADRRVELLNRSFRAPQKNKARNKCGLYFSDSHSV